MLVDPFVILRGHSGEVQCSDFFPSGRFLTGDNDGIAKIWGFEDFRPIDSKRLHDCNAGIISLTSSSLSDSEFLSQGRDGIVRLWKVLPSGIADSAEREWDAGCHNFCRLSIGHVLGRPMLAIPLIEASNVCLWDFQSGQPAMLLPGSNLPGKHGMCMALKIFSPSSSSNSSSSASTSPASTSPASSSSCTLSLAPSTPSSASSSASSSCPPGPPLMLTGLEDGVVALWDLRRVSAPLSYRRMHSESLMTLDVAPSGKNGVSGSADDVISCFALRHAAPASEALSVRKELHLPTAGVSDIKIRHDGRLFASAGWDSKVRLYDMSKEKTSLALLKYHEGQATAVCFSPDLQWTATCSRDKTIALYKLYTPDSS